MEKAKEVNMEPSHKNNDERTEPNHKRPAPQREEDRMQIKELQTWEEARSQQELPEET